MNFAKFLRTPFNIMLTVDYSCEALHLRYLQRSWLQPWDYEVATHVVSIFHFILFISSILFQLLQNWKALEYSETLVQNALIYGGSIRSAGTVSSKCSVEHLFSKISQNSEENACAEVSFSIKLLAFCNFIEKETPAQVFSCKFCEIIIKNTI